MIHEDSLGSEKIWKKKSTVLYGFVDRSAILI